jgi:hypothetical protein
VFEPHREPKPNEFNMWRGFAFIPAKGTDKIGSLLRHIWIVICRRNREKFRYILRWMAWAVQNPEKQSETVVVLRSELEGTGKSTVSEAMRVIFGEHGATLSNPEQLLGSHAGEALENCCFVALEEVLFAGDPRVSDMLKARITGATIHVNPKGRMAYEVPNRMSGFLTTNHSWSAPAGGGARRWFICDVSEEKAGDKEWFDAIHSDLADGGYAQLLGFLKGLRLGKWHPRELVRTVELAEQQIRSAGSVEQWLLDCLLDGGVNIVTDGRLSTHPMPLGIALPNYVLRNSYQAHTRSRGQRLECAAHFGRAMTKILGESSRRENIESNGMKHRGFYLPEADELRARLERSLGVKISEGVR